MTWILDLDGVVWLAEEAIDGSADAIARLHSAGERVVFLTNNSSPRVDDLVAKLAGFGVDAATGDVLTSARAAAALLEPGTRALACAGPGVVEALTARGVQLTNDDDGGAPPDVVVVGWHRDFDYARLTTAFRAVHAGARLIGTNDDPTYPTPEGPIPGGGAILAAVATASGVEPTIAGKPYPPMAAFVREVLGDVTGSVLVGDRPSTDGRMARALGVRFALVLSGVTSAGQLPVDPAPDVTAPDLAALVAQEFA